MEHDKEAPMDPVTRRRFIVAGSAGAIGIAGVAAVGVGPGSLAAAGERELTPAELEAAGPLMLHLRDAATGEIEVLVGEKSIVLTDKSLVAKLLRAAG
jgi:hypothetical protein